MHCKVYRYLLSLLLELLTGAMQDEKTFVVAAPAPNHKRCP